MSRGGKNLIILGLIATFIALLSSGISLFIYHQSGDIYLDRSRPGFLPEKSETEGTSSSNNYEVEETGEVTTETIDEFIENFDQQVKNINSIENPFNPEDISDEVLGISAE